MTPDDPEAALRAWLRDYARDHPRRGFRSAYHDARGEGWIVNHKKIQRLWREEGLRVPRRRRRKRHGISTAAAVAANRPDLVWAADFQFDVTTDGRPIKIVSIVDEHTRESLGGLVERHITGELDRIAADRGAYPAVLRSDNGPEMACAAMAAWAVSPGATATSSRSTPASAMNASVSTASGPWPKPGWSSPIGNTSTTITDGTPRWATYRRPFTLRPAPTDNWPGRGVSRLVIVDLSHGVCHFVGSGPSCWASQALASATQLCGNEKWSSLG